MYIVGGNDTLVKLKIFFNNSCLYYYRFIQNYMLAFDIPNKVSEKHITRKKLTVRTRLKEGN